MALLGYFDYFSIVWVELTIFGIFSHFSGLFSFLLSFRLYLAFFTFIDLILACLTCLTIFALLSFHMFWLRFPFCCHFLPFRPSLLFSCFIFTITPLDRSRLLWLFQVSLVIIGLCLSFLGHMAYFGLILALRRLLPVLTFFLQFSALSCFGAIWPCLVLAFVVLCVRWVLFEIW